MIAYVVLLGLMGVGKTTVGRALARRLCWRLRDSDEEIAALTGQTAAELKRTVGADELHALEAEQLLTALAGEPRAVVCAAASVVDVGRCRAALGGAAVFTVWLRASPQQLADRFARQPHRPAYGDDPLTFLTSQLQARGRLFESVATLSIEASADGPGGIAEQIIAAAGLDR